MLEDQHNRPFTVDMEPAPFWQLLVLSNATDETRFVISFIFHHCLADCLSGVAFHKALAKALSNPLKEEPKRIVDASTMELLPELEKLPRALSSSQRRTSNNQIVELPPGLDMVWAGRNQRLPVRSQFRSIRINKESTHNFLTKCKANRTSLTAAMQTLISEGLFSILPERVTALYLKCAMSLRDWLPKPITNQSTGKFSGSFSQRHRRQSFSWDETRRCRQTIKRIMDEKGQGMPFSHPSTMAVDLRSWFESKIGKPRMSAFEWSNVGHLKRAEDTGSYNANTLLFSQSAGATSGALKISLATGPDGALTVGISWQHGVVEDYVVAHLLEEVPKRIRTLGISNSAD
jgi:Alcohol acetyltransferase